MNMQFTLWRLRHNNSTNYKTLSGPVGHLEAWN